MRYAVIDFETANSNRHSACQVGVVISENGVIVEEFSSLINPQEDFSFYNTNVHGISHHNITNEPIFPIIYEKLVSLLLNDTVFQYSTFDEQVFRKACEKYNLNFPKFDWHDASLLVRETWTDFLEPGFKLSDVCALLNYSYKAHNALEDARATAFVIQEAINKHQISSQDFSRYKSGYVKNKISSFPHREKVSFEGNSNGPLYPNQFVFTDVSSKDKLGKIASQLGANVEDSLTKKTTYLVVGDMVFNGEMNKTTKLKKAEDYIAKGINITIMSESEFNAFVKNL